MGFYDSAFKNVGKQIGFAGAVVGSYMFSKFNKQKSEAANNNAKQEAQAQAEQKKKFQDRINNLKTENKNLWNDNFALKKESKIKDEKIKTYSKGLDALENNIRGLIK